MAISTSADGSLCRLLVHVWSCSLCGPERGCGGQGSAGRLSGRREVEYIVLRTWHCGDGWTGGGQVRGEIGRRCRVPEKAADGLDTQTGNELHPPTAGEPRLPP